MNIEELDDPRARELHKAAVRLSEACVEHEDAWSLRRSYRGVTSTAERRFVDSLSEYNMALASYRTLRSELEKEEKRIVGGWRNEGE